MENKKRNKVLEFLQAIWSPSFSPYCVWQVSRYPAERRLCDYGDRITCRRNAILIVSFILPVLCGMGLNFSIVLGAMAARSD